jgi:hypothetical protein
MKSPHQTKTPAANAQDADEIAIAILGWLSGQPDLMSRFLAMTGIEASDIRRAAQEPGFFGGLTGFLMNHEPTMMAFCADTGIAVGRLQAAHQHFAGPTEGAWL